MSDSVSVRTSSVAVAFELASAVVIDLLERLVSLIKPSGFVVAGLDSADMD